jgi:membrane protease YdiL (CAAX protease family)
MTERQKGALHLGSFMAVFFIAWTARATFLYAVDESIASPTLRAAYSDLLKLLLWVFPAAAFVYWLKGSRPTQYWALREFPRWDEWRPCLLVTGAFLLVVATLALTLAGKSFSFAHIASTPLLLGLLFYIVSPLLEEVFFRGFVLKEMLGLSPMALANVITSVLFVGAHLPYWLSHGGFVPPVPANCAAILLFSLLAGWLFARTRSIWPPTLAHIANNILSALLTP